MSRALQRAAMLAAFIAAATATGTLAQVTTTDPHHPDATATETTPPASGEVAQQDQGLQPAQPGMTSEGMTAGMMQSGMMDRMPMMRMHGHMMKIVFAIADADSDGALSFEEISAIQRRIFDAVDADGSGTVTPEELQSFMRE